MRRLAIMLIVHLIYLICCAFAMFYCGQIKGVLVDYITDNERHQMPMASPLTAVNEFLREKRAAVARDKNKQIFRFGDSNSQANMDELLKSSLSSIGVGLATDKSEDAKKASAQSGGHRVLVKPNVYNVTFLFAPTLKFIQDATTSFASEAYVLQSTSLAAKIVSLWTHFICFYVSCQLYSRSTHSFVFFYDPPFQVARARGRS
jgi:hypothetical protein